MRSNQMKEELVIFKHMHFMQIRIMQVHRYTRRFFGGRQPLCGTGVISRIKVIPNPAA